MTDAGDSAKLVSDADIDALAIRFEDCWRSCDTRTAIREVILPWIEQQATPADGAEALRLAWKAGYDHCDKHATPSSATSEAHNYHDNLPSNKMTLPHAVLAYEPVAWLSPGGDVNRSKKYFEDMGFTTLTPLYASTIYMSPHPIERQAGEFVSVPREFVEVVKEMLEESGGWTAKRLLEMLAAAPAQAAQTQGDV